MYARRVDPSALAFSLSTPTLTYLAFALSIHNKHFLVYGLGFRVPYSLGFQVSLSVSKYSLGFQVSLRVTSSGRLDLSLSPSRPPCSDWLD